MGNQDEGFSEGKPGCAVPGKCSGDALDMRNDRSSMGPPRVGFSKAKTALVSYVLT